jgi:GntR family transcriptional regulator, transcriptional repressor for pyruvate dehydrogenase complex
LVKWLCQFSEGTCVVHAAQRPAPAGETAGLRDALQRLAGATGSASAWIAADTVFHAMAVQAAGNTYLTALYEGVHTAVLAREYDHWVQTETEPTWLAPPAVPLLDLHRAIYDAVAVGDAEAARDAVLRHHQVMLEHLAAAPGMPPLA